MLFFDVLLFNFGVICGLVGLVLFTFKKAKEDGDPKRLFDGVGSARFGREGIPYHRPFGTVSLVLWFVALVSIAFARLG